MYLPLKRGDHVTDEDGLVHVVITVNKALMAPTTGEVLSNAYSVVCRPSHQCSLVGWDYDIEVPQITQDPVTCITCLANHERT